MAMKQTQTKLFDFSDVGLDFCAGSKSLFPDRFKKMLALGYNVQTVTNVAIVGDQVTLTYGGAHGYVADRVLKVDSGALSEINGGEFFIDSVTTNTVKFTAESVPVSIPHGFTTRIAPLGWSLEYEAGLVQLYKMKYLDERDLFVRFVFTDPTNNYKNVVNICAGKTADLTSGVITDVHADGNGKTNITTQSGFCLQFTVAANSTTQASYTYSQGFGAFGKGCVIGSKYHFLISSHAGVEDYATRIQGVTPCNVLSHDSLDYPLILGCLVANVSAGTSTAEVPQASGDEVFKIGKNLVSIGGSPSPSDSVSQVGAAAAYLPDELYGQQTTSAYPVWLHEKITKQFLGNAYGVYRVDYPSSNSPAFNRPNSPSLTSDIDLDNKILLHPVFVARGTTSYRFFAMPIEVIKYAT